MAADRKIKEAIVQYLRENGGRASNTSTYEGLNLGLSEYFDARNELIFEGVVARGRGRGGSTILVQKDDLPPVEANLDIALGVISIDSSGSTEESESIVIESKKITEQDHYEPILSCLQAEWSKDQSLSTSYAAICANNKRGGSGGSWSVPDLVVWGKRSFKFIKDPVYSVYTFEVKRADDFDIRAIYEATAHRMAATYSYVISVGENKSDIDRRILKACGETGVGLILAIAPGEFSTWDEIVEARRNEPDPEAFENFVQWSLSEFESDIIMAMK